MSHLWTQFRRDHGGARLKVELGHLSGLFQPKLSCDAINLIFFYEQTGDKRLDGSPVGREMAFLVDGKLNMIQPCALVEKRANYLKILECVQRSTTKMVKGAQGISDQEWLKILGFFRLEETSLLSKTSSWLGVEDKVLLPLSSIWWQMQGEFLKLMSMPETYYWLRETSSSALSVF